MNYERRIIFTLWTVVGAALLMDILLRPGGLYLRCVLTWSSAFSVTGLGFWHLGRQSQREILRTHGWFWLGLQATAIITSVAYSERANLFGGALLVITAWQASKLWPLRGALLWCLLQTLGLGTAVAFMHSDLRWISGVLILGGLQVFAALAARMAQTEMESRLALAERSSELREVQELLLLGSRASERLRLARELHDGLGHRLTALSLNLEAAQHLPPAEAPGVMRKSQAMTHEILADLRRMVSRMREPDSVDLETSLRALVEEIRNPRIHLDLKGSWAELETPVAHALVRCVQEFTTNAIKHAGAKNLWIELSFGAEGARLDVRDDGRGVERLDEGHGLKGMRERLEPLGGRLELSHGPGSFQAAVWIPA